MVGFMWKVEENLILKTDEIQIKNFGAISKLSELEDILLEQDRNSYVEFVNFKQLIISRF